MRRLDNIDLRLLRVFVTLAEAGSFPAAQIALNLSQSTLSTHIANLERRIGEPLCLRGRKGFKLTPAGEATLAATRQLFNDIDVFEARIKGATGRATGRLRIGIVDGVATSERLGLQGAIRCVMDAAPDAFLDVRLGTPHQLEIEIAEGQFDVAIGPFAQQAPGVRYVPIFREPQALYCGADHELFDLPAAEQTPERISQALFSVRGYRHLEDLYRVNHPRANARVFHMEAQLMLILSGKFIGYLPRHMGDPYVERGELALIRPQKFGFLSQHYVAYRRPGRPSPFLDFFIDAVRRQAKEKP